MGFDALTRMKCAEYLDVEFVRSRKRARNKKSGGHLFLEGRLYTEEIWRLPESPKTQKNLPEFHQQELATLIVAVTNEILKKNY